MAAVLKLEAFISEFGTRRWVWGEMDCCMALASWLIECGHADLLEPFRGRYDSKESSERIIAAHGSLVDLIDAQATRIGLKKTTDVARGNIGVIGSPRRGLRQWGSIHDGARWQVRNIEGFIHVSAPVLSMWSI